MREVVGSTALSDQAIKANPPKRYPTCVSCHRGPAEAKRVADAATGHTVGCARCIVTRHMRWSVLCHQLRKEDGKWLSDWGTAAAGSMHNASMC